MASILWTAFLSSEKFAGYYSHHQTNWNAGTLALVHGGVFKFKGILNLNDFGFVRKVIEKHFKSTPAFLK